MTCNNSYLKESGKDDYLFQCFFAIDIDFFHKKTLCLGNFWSLNKLNHMMSRMSEGKHHEKWRTLESGSLENYGGQWHLNRLYICDTGQRSMRKTLSDLRQRDIKQMWGQRSTALCRDATLIRDPCRSQVSCYHIRVFMGPFIGLSCKQAEHCVSGIAPLRNHETLITYISLRFLLHDQHHFILFLNVGNSATSAPVQTGIRQQGRLQSE